MTLFLKEFNTLSIFLLFCFFLSIVILFFLMLYRYSSDSEKSFSYDCGFNSYEDAENEVDVRVFLIAIIIIKALEYFNVVHFC
jgi:NADH:ubiquinone oxidoreductase subunit 3 (subunit A)